MCPKSPRHMLFSVYGLCPISSVRASSPERNLASVISRELCFLPEAVTARHVF